MTPILTLALDPTPNPTKSQECHLSRSRKWLATRLGVGDLGLWPVRTQTQTQEPHESAHAQLTQEQRRHRGPSWPWRWGKGSRRARTTQMQSQAHARLPTQLGALKVTRTAPLAGAVGGLWPSAGHSGAVSIAVRRAIRSRCQRAPAPRLFGDKSGDASKCPFFGGPNGGGIGDTNVATAIVFIAAVVAMRALIVRMLDVGPHAVWSAAIKAAAQTLQPLWSLCCWLAAGVATSGAAGAASR